MDINGSVAVVTGGASGPGVGGVGERSDGMHSSREAPGGPGECAVDTGRSTRPGSTVAGAARPTVHAGAGDHAPPPHHGRRCRRGGAGVVTVGVA